MRLLYLSNQTYFCDPRNFYPGLFEFRVRDAFRIIAGYFAARWRRHFDDDHLGRVAYEELCLFADGGVYDDVLFVRVVSLDRHRLTRQLHWSIKDP